MGYNFIECNREQQYLMPPSVKEWLPEGDLSWFVIDAVGQMELEEFYSKYRGDGCGRAAFNPKMMVSLLLYGYSLGERSSRRIEILCERDVGFRVLILAVIDGALGSNTFLIFSSFVVTVTPTSMSLNSLIKSKSLRTRGDIVTTSLT